jgi:hypothetical protein
MITGRLNEIEQFYGQSNAAVVEKIGCYRVYIIRYNEFCISCISRQVHSHGFRKIYIYLY